MTQKPFITKQVSGSNGETYIVCVYEAFDTCTCPGFRHREKCKHTAQAREEFLQDLDFLKS